MSALPSENLLWGPGFIGLMVGTALYGVGVGQFIFYVREFPHDRLALKGLVFIVFILDSAQTFALAWFYHHILVECHSSTSTDCLLQLPPSVIVGIVTVYWVTFIVQSFYAHRVWIISDHNRIVTTAVILFATAQLVLGLLCTVDLIRYPTFQELSTTEFSPLSAVASAACDVVITLSIAYYLRPTRTGVIRRKGNFIKKLNALFVQMGLFTCINALVMVILFYIQDRQLGALLTAAPGAMLSKTYLNSMLSVLNARKSIREQEHAQRAISLPTIPTIR